MTDAKQIVQAEKSGHLTPQNLHIRLRVLEVITLLSLILNLALWFFAGNINTKVENGTPVQSTR